VRIFRPSSSVCPLVYTVVAGSHGRMGGSSGDSASANDPDTTDLWRARFTNRFSDHVYLTTENQDSNAPEDRISFDPKASRDDSENRQGRSERRILRAQSNDGVSSPGPSRLAVRLRAIGLRKSARTFPANGQARNSNYGANCADSRHVRGRMPGRLDCLRGRYGEW
jgi:hypothetical protein